MSEDKKNGRNHLATVGVIAGLIAGPFMVWGTLNAEAGRQKEKIEQLEKRQAEDRSSFRRDQQEIKNDVKEVKQDVQTILRKLDSMDAAQRARRDR
jgi:Na+/glutamate symporter